MKQILVLLIAMLYLATTVGASVEIHYCMGKSAGANFVHKDDGKCRRCGMKNDEKKGCCKDEHHVFKTSDHTQFKADFHVNPVEINALVPAKHYTNYRVFLKTAKSNITARANAPPPLVYKCPIYLRIRNLRI
ncbi:MAG: hypothetical protein H7257_00835 [Taibaiella sp.]|nr:hypothetical protein [Taibaiella sp.]